MKRGLRLVFADIVKKELKRQGISQSQMARDIGWSISSVNNICRARRQTSINLLNDIFDYLQIEIGYRSNAPEA